MDREKLWPYLRRNISDLYRSRIKSKLRDPVTKSHIPKKNPCVIAKNSLNLSQCVCCNIRQAQEGRDGWSQSHVKPCGATSKEEFLIGFVRSSLVSEPKSMKPSFSQVVKTPPQPSGSLNGARAIQCLQLFATLI